MTDIQSNGRSEQVWRLISTQENNFSDKDSDVLLALYSMNLRYMGVIHHSACLIQPANLLSSNMKAKTLTLVA